MIGKFWRVLNDDWKILEGNSDKHVELVYEVRGCVSLHIIGYFWSMYFGT